MRGTYAAAGIWKITSSGIIPTRIPNAVALAPSDFAYSTMGLPRMIWNENALKAANQNAFVKPDGNRLVAVAEGGALKTFPERGVADAPTLRNGLRRIAWKLFGAKIPACSQNNLTWPVNGWATIP